MKIEDKELKAIKARIASNGGIERCSFANSKVSIRTNNKPIQVNNITNTKYTNSMTKETRTQNKTEQTNENILHRAIREAYSCLLYTSPSPRDGLLSRMPSSA